MFVLCVLNDFGAPLKALILFPQASRVSTLRMSSPTSVSVRDIYAVCIIVTTYCVILNLSAATEFLTHTNTRKSGETFCQLETPRMTTEIAEIAHQRRKHAIIVLRTDISYGQGLTNQHVNLVSLITLALAGDVDRVLLPTQKHRSHFSLGASWQEAPTEDLWDIHSLKGFLKERGVGVQASHSKHPDECFLILN